MMPAALIGRWVAECKVIEGYCRSESKESIEASMSYIIQCKVGVFVVGLGVGIGWIGRKVRHRAPKVEKHDVSKAKYIQGK